MPLLILFSRLPFWALYLISDFLTILVRDIIRYRLKVVRTNLRKSFPEKTDKELNRIARSFYRGLMDVMLESVKSLTISPAELKKRVTIANPEIILQHANKQGLLVLTAHQCNWEWQLLRNSLEFNFPIDGVYKPLTSAFTEKLMFKIRSRFGANPVPAQNLVRHMASNKNAFRATAVVADQVASRENAVWLNFLNQETAFYIGGPKLAIKFGYPLVYLQMTRTSRGHYVMHFTEISTQQNPEDGVAKYAQLLEKSIKTQPEAWLWSHKRWKNTRPDDKVLYTSESER